VGRNFTKHKIEDSVLREYDIRGIVGKTISKEDAFFVGKSLASWLNINGIKKPKCVVGFDGRLSSSEFSDNICLGLIESGCEVINIGRGPTPLLYYAANRSNSHAGIMVTGSHNPPEYNGFKIVVDNKPFYGPKIQELGKISNHGKFINGKGVSKTVDFSNDYLEEIFNSTPSLPALKVAWDPGNGSAGELIESLVKKLPGEHILINSKIDGNFPSHHPDPTVPENLEQLRALVTKEKCDLGFAFDGDGDRIGIIDKFGRILWGDQYIALLAQDVLADSPGATIIGDVKCSQVLFDEILRLKGIPLMWKTGHSCIKEKMQEVSSPLAGEMSGHIFFSDRWFGFDDAIYAAVRLLMFLDEKSTPLSELYNSLPKAVNTPELRFDCPDEQKFMIIQEVLDRLQGDKFLDIVTVDGIRVNRTGGWWLLRASNTQPALVARVEAEDKEALGELTEELCSQLIESGLEPPDNIQKILDS
tara:strand:- start:32750 stop:34171 length:1422 start_codon:yes stop_codon:yes gene_type:complete